MEAYDTYIKNVLTIRNLSKVVIEDNDSKETIIDKIKENAAIAYDIKKWNDNFLDDFLYKKDSKDLNKEDIEKLTDFVYKLFNYQESIDISISYKIFEKLMEYYKYTNDVPNYIKYLYYAGTSLFYIDSKDNEKGQTEFQNKMGEYFKQGASFLDELDKYDVKTRAFIIRCLGNIKVDNKRKSKQDIKDYYQLFDKAMSIIKSNNLRNKYPDLDWDTFEYGMNMDQLSILDYLRNNKDGEVANRVLEAATYIYNAQNRQNNSHYASWQVDYYYNVALYHAGKLSIIDLVNKIREIVNNADINDFSVNGINANLTLTGYLLFYVSLLDKDNKEILSKELNEDIKRSYKYLDRLPGDQYKYSVSQAIRELVSMQSMISDNDKTDMMNYLVAFHKPTYVHSLMVAKICEALTACVLMKCPENLIGVLDCRSKEDVLAKKEEIINLAYNCGIYHDVGKDMCMGYISINERDLIKEEFECIKTHTTLGYELLNKNKNNDNKYYAIAALYHHRYYNNLGGYPELVECPSFIKPIVDILSVADSIDASTDSIGRHYKKAKDLKELIEEFNEEKGSRYAPFVIDLFKDISVYNYINNIVLNERILVYLNVYHKGKSYTISTYNQ